MGERIVMDESYKQKYPVRRKGGESRIAFDDTMKAL
jgi:hypothetical protein